MEIIKYAVKKMRVDIVRVLLMKQKLSEDDLLQIVGVFHEMYNVGAHPDILKRMIKVFVPFFSSEYSHIFQRFYDMIELGENTLNPSRYQTYLPHFDGFTSQYTFRCYS